MESRSAGVLAVCVEIEGADLRKRKRELRCIRARGPIVIGRDDLRSAINRNRTIAHCIAHAKAPQRWPEAANQHVAARRARHDEAANQGLRVSADDNETARGEDSRAADRCSTARRRSPVGLEVKRVAAGSSVSTRHPDRRPIRSWSRSRGRPHRNQSAWDWDMGARHAKRGQGRTNSPHTNTRLVPFPVTVTPPIKDQRTTRITCGHLA